MHIYNTQYNFTILFMNTMEITTCILNLLKSNTIRYLYHFVALSFLQIAWLQILSIFIFLKMHLAFILKVLHFILLRKTFLIDKLFLFSASEFIILSSASIIPTKESEEIFFFPAFKIFMLSMFFNNFSMTFFCDFFLFIHVIRILRYSRICGLFYFTSFGKFSSSLSLNIFLINFLLLSSLLTHMLDIPFICHTSFPLFPSIFIFALCVSI